jgi:hypothetical protein
MSTPIDTPQQAEINAHAGVDTTPTNTETILKELLARSLNMFQAEKLGEHVICSTISTLSNRHGIQFQRQWETVPNSFGGKIRVVRYSIPASALENARRVLAQFKARRPNCQR